MLCFRTHSAAFLAHYAASFFAMTHSATLSLASSTFSRPRDESCFAIWQDLVFCTILSCVHARFLLWHRSFTCSQHFFCKHSNQQSKQSRQSSRLGKLAKFCIREKTFSLKPTPEHLLVHKTFPKGKLLLYFLHFRERLLH